MAEYFDLIREFVSLAARLKDADKDSKISDRVLLP
jgi:hypothetical protein